uniref:Eukaryotic translation initiation factor 3 subunit A n=1 Tax=Anthurium amnicola TaxID=1678845 RepID=A0A1D1Z3C8_9ARAE
MGSKGRMQPHLRRPLPVPAVMHPDPFISGIRPPPGPFFDMLPPPEIMEQKLAAQHGEMQKLATENERLAATHVVLRQELAGAQQELQRLQTQMGVMKAEKEQHMKGLHDKIAKMEADLQASEMVKVELQQARAEAQNLVAIREELISKVQHLSQDLRRSHVDVQQIPAMMSELEGLRREYQDCRFTYEYEKKLYSDHLESLQVMEKNYISMSREVEKLRSELANSGNPDRRGGGQYGANATYQENDPLAPNASAQNTSSQLPVGQNTYEDGYNVTQGRVPPAGSTAPYGGSAGGAAPTRMGYDAPRGTGYEPPRAANYDAARGGSYDASRGGAGYDSSRGGTGFDASRASGAGYDPSKGTGAAYDASRVAGAGYDATRVAGSGYDNPRGAATGYDASRGAAYDASRASVYDAPRGASLGYDASRAASYEVPRGSGYDAPRGPGGAHTAALPANNAAYGSVQTPTHTGDQPRGNVVRR